MLSETGQHPGGIVIPNYMDVSMISPVQYPADDDVTTQLL